MLIEDHRELLTGLRGAPNVLWDVTLQNHVIAEDGRKAGIGKGGQGGAEKNKGTEEMVVVHGLEEVAAAPLQYCHCPREYHGMAGNLLFWRSWRSGIPRLSAPADGQACLPPAAPANSGRQKDSPDTTICLGIPGNSPLAGLAADHENANVEKVTENFSPRAAQSTAVTGGEQTGATDGLFMRRTNLESPLATKEKGRRGAALPASL